MKGQAVWSVGHLTIDDLVYWHGAIRMGNVGGDALYAALGASVMGVPSVVVSRLGQEFPPAALQDYAGTGVDMSVKVVGAPSIRQWVLYESDGSRTFVMHPGSGSLEEMSPVINEHDIPYGSTVHVAPMPVGRQRAWCEALVERGCSVTLDPHEDSCVDSRAEVLGLLPLVRAFLPSEREASRLVAGSPSDAVRTFRGQGAAIAGVKIAGAGSVVAFSDEMWHVPALPVRVRDATGAGDSYCGAFAAALSEGHDGLLAACWATAAASVIVEALGTEVDREACGRGTIAKRIEAIHPVRLSGVRNVDEDMSEREGARIGL